jgi:hypothetical protein
MDWFFPQSLPLLFAGIIGAFFDAPRPLADQLTRAAPHLRPVGTMAAFVGLVVFVTVALAHPFQGAVTPSEEGDRLIADRPFGGPPNVEGD